MSVQTPDATRPSVPRPPSTARARLPIVEFRAGTPPFAVHYSAVTAAHAGFDHPDSELFDLRGAKVSVAVDDLSLRLVAAADGDEPALQERVLDALRAAAKQAAGGGRIPADFEDVLSWLAAAPGVDYLVHALGLAEVDDPMSKIPCKYCNTSQLVMWGHPTCCPKK